MSMSFRKFRLLLWKNFTLHFRSPLNVIFEIFIPIMLCWFMVYNRSLVVPRKEDYISKFEPLSLNLTAERLLSQFMPDIDTDFIKSIGAQFSILYSPKNDHLDELMKHIETYLSPYAEIESFKTHREMEVELQKNELAYVGVEFPESYENLTKFPSTLNYSLRYPAELRIKTHFSPIFSNWQTNDIFPIFMLSDARSSLDYDATGYYKEGFVLLQDLIMKAFMSCKDKSFMDAVPDLFVQKFPHPPGVYDPLLILLQFMFSMFFMLTYIYPVISMVKTFVEEKEMGIQQSMEIMGEISWHRYTTWFINFFLNLTIINIIIIFIFKQPFFDSPAVLPKASPSVVFVLLTIYSLTTIAFAFMISTFFTNSSKASAVTVMLWMLSFHPYRQIIMSTTYRGTSATSKKVLSLLHNSAVSIGMRIILSHEHFDGFKWKNLNDFLFDNVNLKDMLMMMVIDGGFYVLTTLVINFCGSKLKELKVKKKDEFEVLESLDFTKTIEVRDVCKTYNKECTALENISMDFYEDQITVILGENGAGKSTFLSILCGLIKQTSGSITFTSKPSIGVCFQKNILFDNLTVKEHIYFYSILKGLSEIQANYEVKKFIKLLKFEEKSSKLSSTLSGGMKRKLSLAIALCGYSKIVLLDEVSSGIDPTTQKDLWNLLQKEKKGRTILLSTHSMVEAEVLGDRVAVLCEKKLKGIGSVSELKDEFCETMKLNCSFLTNNHDEMKKCLKNFEENVKVLSENGNEVVYEMKKIENFKELLSEVDGRKNELGLKSFDVVLSSLEDLFNEHSPEPPQQPTDDSSVPQFPYERFQLIKNQFKALLMKKLLYNFHNFPLFALQVLSPILLLLMTFFVTKDWHRFDDLKPLELSLTTYQPSKTFIKIDKEIERNSIEYEIYENYLGQFENHDFEVINGDMNEYFLDNSKTYQDLNMVNLFGVSINKENITAWFNDQSLHTFPISLNLLHNSIANLKNLSINVVNKPLPYKSESKLNFLGDNFENREFLLNINICFGMIFVVSLFIINLVNERVEKSKHLQYLSSISPLTYWISNFTYDLAIYLLISILTILTYMLGKNQFDLNEFLRIFLLFTLFGFSSISFIYAGSFLYKSSSSAFIKTLAIAFLIGPIGYLGVSLIKNSDKTSINNIEKKIKTTEKFFMFSPFYAFPDGFMKLIGMREIQNLCGKLCSNFGICGTEDQCQKLEFCCDTNYFSWKSEHGISKHLVHLTVTSIFFIYVLFIIEFKIIPQLFSTIKYFLTSILNRISKFIPTSQGTHRYSPQVDLDVLKERTLVNSLRWNELTHYSLTLRNLSKSYKSTAAVKKLSIAIKPGECFGLLGENGSGKTSTFRMLTGDLKIDFGEVFIEGIDLKNKKKEALKKIGYCPQFDALFEDLTPRETLKFYAMSHGIRSPQISSLIDKISCDFDFTNHLDKKVKELSGGNKRKLSTAIALLGSSVILLDEPTTSMDPLVRRKFWKVITKLRESGKTIILSSHSMEECEATCTRIGIMSRGELKCLGSSQHLKEKFGDGVLLRIKLRKIDDEEMARKNELEVKEIVEKSIDGARLKEQFHENLIFHLPMRWSEAFRMMEEIKIHLNIEDFSLRSMDLNEIFYKVTKK